MGSYLEVIGAAMILFPLLALVITLPYMLWQYKKFGSIPLLRTAVVYSFVLYCMTAYFLAILPLPDPADVARRTGPVLNLLPYESIWKFLQGKALAAPATYWALLRSDSFRESFFNVCMFFPLGVYLRYYFRRNWWQTVLIGLCCSLFLELTQLTGLYGIYPRPYRLCDTTDLCNNTLGALVGYWATPLLCFFLPTREQLDRRAYQRGQKVPFLRRFLALCLDWAILAAVYVGAKTLAVRLLPALYRLQWLKAVLYAAGVFFYFVLLQWLSKGRTPGKAFLHLRLVTNLGTRPHFWQYLVRYGLLYGLILPSPVYAMLCLDAALTSQWAVPLAGGMAGAAVFAAVLCVFAAGTLSKLLGSEHEYLYGRLSRTKNISTLAIPAQARETAETPEAPLS